MRLRGVTLLTLVVLCSTLASTARAAAPCDDLRGDHTYWVGARLNASQYTGRLNGTRANLFARDPALCSQGTTNRYSLAWVGLTNFDDGLIQIGYWKHETLQGTNVLRFFAEWFLCAPDSCNHQQEQKTVSVGTLNDGSTFSYRLLRDASGTGKVAMMICTSGTNTCDTVMTADDPYMSPPAWGSNARAFDSGETQNINTDLPGTEPERADFDNMQAFIGGGSWQDYDFSYCAYDTLPDCAGTPPYRYHEQWAPNTPPRNHLEIWTDPT